MGFPCQEAGVIAWGRRNSRFGPSSAETAGGDFGYRNVKLWQLRLPIATSMSGPVQSGSSEKQSDFKHENLDTEQAQATFFPQNILLYLVAFRIVNALCVKTFFQPDEYFQSLEPAWEIAFGSERGAWITWARKPDGFAVLGP